MWWQPYPALEPPSTTDTTFPFELSSMYVCQCSLHITHYTLYTTHSTVYTTHCTVYITHYTVSLTLHVDGDLSGHALPEAVSGEAGVGAGVVAGDGGHGVLPVGGHLGVLVHPGGEGRRGGGGCIDLGVACVCPCY